MSVALVESFVFLYTFGTVPCIVLVESVCEIFINKTLCT